STRDHHERNQRSRCPESAIIFRRNQRSQSTGISDHNGPEYTLYRELDQQFPGSLFILSTRAIEAWLASTVAGFEEEVAERGCLNSVARWAYGTDRIDEGVLRARYLKHNKDVLGYFSGRPDFLVVDVTRDNPWTPLCEFLGLPVPEAPFPHLNRRATP
ncbi:MAG: sulfotransferase, partial [Gammaproteobacteria bacterium]